MHKYVVWMEIKWPANVFNILYRWKIIGNVEQMGKLDILPFELAELFIVTLNTCLNIMISLHPRPLLACAPPPHPRPNDASIAEWDFSFSL